MVDYVSFDRILQNKRRNLNRKKLTQTRCDLARNALSFSLKVGFSFSHGGSC